MKHALMLAAAAMSLAGCQKSIDSQFKEMCADQKANDPVAWSSSEGVCRYADNLDDSQKKVMLEAYAELRRARAAVERSEGQ